MPSVPVLLSAASFARFRHGKFGLFRRPKLPEYIPKVAADSGGFVASRRASDYAFVAIQYVEWLCSFAPRWAATMDFPVEPELAATAWLSASSRSAQPKWRAFFWDQFPDVVWPWVPTVQGWDVDDYVRHAEDLRPLVMDMQREYNPWSWDREDLAADALAAQKADAFRVGIGTLCRRTSARLVHQIVQAVVEVLPGVPLHLWGIKVSTLQSVLALPPQVVSVDSAAWNGRFGRNIERARLEQHRLRLTQGEHAVRVALPRYLTHVEDALLAPKQLSLGMRTVRAR